MMNGRGGGGGTESYRLVPIENGIRLVAEVDAVETFEDFMNEHFPKALQVVKTLAEQQKHE